MRLKIRNPFYLKPKNKTDQVKVLCYHCGRIYSTTYENIRVGNYCLECK